MALQNNHNLKKLIVSAIVSMFFSVLGALSIFGITNRSPSLEYEILPLSHFKRDSIQVSIVNVKILNSGKKECENVEMNVEFSSDVKAIDYSIEKSSPSINLVQKFDSTNNNISYSIAYLNARDQIKYSFLLDKVIDKKDVKVDLRSKGVIGTNSTSSDALGISNVLIFGTFGMFFMGIILTTVFIFYQRKLIRSQEAEINRLKKQAEGKI